MSAPRVLTSRLLFGAAAVLLLVCGGSAATAATATTFSPLAGQKLWVDPNSAAAQATQTANAHGDRTSAAALSKLAAQPTALWLSSGNNMPAFVSGVIHQARSAAAIPVFVTYYLPGRDCSGYSSGGAPSFAAYQGWVSSIAAAIGDAAAAVVVEPDAVAEMTVGCLSTHRTRYANALAAEISTFKQHPHVAVYLDAGNPRWVGDTSRLAATLRASGISQADGFALNVSNFFTKADDMNYGTAVSSQVAGKHFVVDTSRNGLGPLPPGSGYAGPSWCNPPGRAVGDRPATTTSYRGVDALLWVKTPGASDGSCGLGDPPAGQFWPSYAVGLAERASW